MNQFITGGIWEQWYEDRYLQLMGNCCGVYSSAETDTKFEMPVAGTFHHLYEIGRNYSGQTTYGGTVTLRVNGTSTSLSAVGTNGSDEIHSVHVNAGDLISVLINNVADGTIGAILWSVLFAPDTGNTSVYFTRCYNSSANTYYYAPSGTNKTSVNIACQNIMPMNCTVSNLRVFVNAAAGVGKSRTFIILKNGVETSLQVTISDLETSKVDTATVSFTEGDGISIKSYCTGSPTAVYAYVSFSIESEVAGASPLFGSYVSSLEARSIYSYNGMANHTYYDTGGVESPLQYCTLSHAYFQVDVAPGSGKSRTINWTYVGASSPPISVTISDSATSNSDLVTTVDLTAPATRLRLFCNDTATNTPATVSHSNWSARAEVITVNICSYANLVCRTKVLHVSNVVCRTTILRVSSKALVCRTTIPLIPDTTNLVCQLTSTSTLIKSIGTVVYADINKTTTLLRTSMNKCVGLR